MPSFSVKVLVPDMMSWVRYIVFMIKTIAATMVVGHLV